MVQFNFQARFVIPIELMTKRQTIRHLRLRNARPGDILQLQTGSRFKPRRIGLATCTGAGSIHLGLAAGLVTVRWMAGSLEVDTTDLDAFAVRDGFQDWADLRAFWRATHDASDSFEGWLTSWGDTFKGPLDPPPV